MKDHEKILIVAELGNPTPRLIVHGRRVSLAEAKGMAKELDHAVWLAEMIASDCAAVFRAQEAMAKAAKEPPKP